MPAFFPLKLVEHRMLAPSVAHFTLTRDDGQDINYIPGQFIQIHFNYADGTPTKRSYSIATQLKEHRLNPKQLDIVVSYVPGGAATSLFEQMHAGDTLNASGPLGRFCLMPADTNKRYILIATGTGITPYRSMLSDFRNMMQERDTDIVLFYGVRTPEELLYGEEFRQFANEHSKFRYIPCFSRELPAADSVHAHPDVRHGYVQNFLSEINPNAETDIAYLCGNPNMVDACFETLKASGLGMQAIRREKYISLK